MAKLLAASGKRAHHDDDGKPLETVAWPISGLLYRLALGQPDQEDLVELLTHHDLETTRSLQALTLNLSAFSREARG